MLLIVLIVQIGRKKMEFINENTTCLLASTSPIKLEVVKSIFPNVDSIDCSILNLADQPVGVGGKMCARARLNYAKQKAFPKDYDFYVSIENYIDKKDSENTFKDQCIVLIEHKGLLSAKKSKFKFNVEIGTFSEIISSGRNKYGYNRTAGEFYSKKYGCDSKNWMKELYGIDRRQQFKSGILAALNDVSSKRKISRELVNKYTKYLDFPKVGVQYWDLFSVIKEREDIKLLMELLVSQYKYDDIDYIVGPESRGFFGFGVSVAGGYGFIPIRKKGKLPGTVERITYTTEYSEDTLEMQVDAVPEDSRVLVFDDLIATGGSLRAVCDLLEKAKCNIIDCVVLVENKNIREQAKEKLGRSYTVLIQE